MLASGFGIRNSGFEIRDSGFGIRDPGLGGSRERGPVQPARCLGRRVLACCWLRDSGFGFRISGGHRRVVVVCMFICVCVCVNIYMYIYVSIYKQVDR